MGFNYKKFKRALVKQIKKYKGVVNARPTGLGRTTSSSSSSCDDLSKSCRGLSNILDEFRDLDDEVDTSEVMYAVAQVERRISNAVGQVSGADKEVLKVTQEASRVSKRLQNKDVFTAYPQVYKKKIKAFKSAYSKILKDIAKEGGIQFSSDRMAEVQSQLSRSFNETHSLIEKAMSFGLDSQNQITGETKKLADYVEAALEKQLKDILALGSSVNKELSAAHHLKDASVQGSKTMRDESKEFMGNMERIKNQLMRRDFLAVAKSVSTMTKPKNKPPGTDALSKAVKGMSKSMSFLGILQIVIDTIKQGVGLLLGVNNKAAEFNKALTETHGLVSQGYDTNFSVDTNDIPKQFHKFQEMILSYGADSGTFVNPKEILAITGAFEAQGVKLKHITGNAEQFGSMMTDVLGYSLQSGMSTTEMAGIMGDWEQNFHMNSGLVRATLDNFMLAQEDTGMPARLLMDTVLSANFDYETWGDSMNTVLDLQKKNLKRGVSTIAAGKKGIEALFDMMTNTKPINFAYMLQELPHGKFNEMVEADIARVRKSLSSASTPEDKSKFEYQLNKLESLKKLDKGHAMNSYFGSSVGSAESKGDLMKQSLNAKFGDGLKQALKDKSMSTEMEYQLKFFLGHTDTTQAQWEAIMSALDLLLNTDVDFEKSLEGINKAQQDRAKQEELRKKALATVMPHLKTIDEMMEAAWNKILVQIIKAADGIIAWLTQLLSNTMIGGDTNTGDEARKAAAESDLLEACVRVSQMEKGKDRDKAVDELRNQIGAAKASGVDLNQVAITLASKGVAADIIQRVQSAGGGNLGGITGSGGFGEKGLLEALNQSGMIKDATERAQFMAQMKHETDYFKASEEYSSGAQYEGQKDLGNTQQGDGVRFKGRGYVMLTGRANYAKYGKMVGVDLIKNPELAAKPDVAAKIAIAYWNDRVKGTYGVKDFTDTTKVTKAIQGGNRHLAERKAAFAEYMKNPSALTGGVRNVPSPTPPPKQQAPKASANPAKPVAAQANKLSAAAAPKTTNQKETHTHNSTAGSNAQVISAVRQ